MQVRPRRDDDLGECVRLARLVHETDRYPAYLPGDLESFLVSPRPDSAWVAVHDGELVGHVALHRRSSELDEIVFVAPARPEPTVSF